jgi:hypothetical protein
VAQGVGPEFNTGKKKKKTSHHIQNQSEWIKHIRATTYMKFLQENIGVNLGDFGLGIRFLDMTLKDKQQQ